jgi:hypothetical protein
MKRQGGLGEPLLYAVIGGCLSGIVSFLFSIGLHSVGLFADRHDAFTAMAGMGIGSVVIIILLPLFVIIGLFIVSAVVHVCLMIVGGANQPFETTYRVVAFLRAHWSSADDPGLWRGNCRCLGARLHLHRRGARTSNGHRPRGSCRFTSRDCLLRRNSRRGYDVWSVRRLEHHTTDLRQMHLCARRLTPSDLDHELLWLSVSVSLWRLQRLGWRSVCLACLCLPRVDRLPCLTCGMTRCGIQFFHGHFPLP